MFVFIAAITCYILLSNYQIYTSVGSDTLKVLTEDCIDAIYNEAREKYLTSDQFGEGLQYIMEEYR